jgi:hypothetical protein
MAVQAAINVVRQPVDQVGREERTGFMGSQQRGEFFDRDPGESNERAKSAGLDRPVSVNGNSK